MAWIEIASELFALRWEIVWVIGALYLVPLVRLVTFPISLGHPFFMIFNRRLGQFEHLVAWFRDTVVVTYLFLAGLWHISIGIDIGKSDRIALGAVCLALVLLSIANYYWKRSGRRRLLDFISIHPTIHPKEFIDHLLCCAGGVRHHFPNAPYQTIDPCHLDFRSPKFRRIGLINFLAGLWCTIKLAKMPLLALKWKGRDFFMEVCSSGELIWSLVCLWMVHAEVIVEGAQSLAGLQGFNIYLFNHMSFFDFIIAPLVLAARSKMNERKAILLPRFLLAKNHFLDNPLFYRILGIGRSCREFGMVFVERRGRGATANAAVDEAAEKLIRDGIDFVVYPQGTRARGRLGPAGERIDAGYYAVGSLERLKRDADHLKKGPAHIATTAALMLQGKGIDAQINLIPVALKGTGIVVPKGLSRVKPNVTVRMHVGEPIIVRPQDVAGIGSASSQPYMDFVLQLHRRIDQALKSAVGIHAELERRFFEDMRTLVEPLAIEEMAVAMKQWRGEDYLVHAILDCIYTCKAKHWRPFLGRLIYLIRHDAPRDDLLAFKGEVAEKMVGS